MSTNVTACRESGGPLPLRPKHIMSIDVEDYFMVEAFAGSITRDSWPSWPSRVVQSTYRILDLLGQYNVKGTFFFVGWVARKFPHLVRDVIAHGHELGCHSFWHRPVYSLTREQFREDTKLALRAIEDSSGVRVHGYRAPSWSITGDCLWALDILAEEGFSYDSSIYPIHHDLYGVPGAQRFPYTVNSPRGAFLREYPPATIRFLGQNFPAAGGGYLRILPLAYTHWVFRHFERRYGGGVVTYLHPWELDPEQPRVNEKLKSRLRHYTNLVGMKNKLESLLQLYSFQCFRDFLAAENERESASNNFQTTSATTIERLQVG